MATDLSSTVNVGSVSYEVELEQVQNSYKISQVQLIAPTIQLYFNPSLQVFEIYVYSNVVYKVQVNGGIKDVFVNARVAKEIQNYGFCALWGQLSKQSPFSNAVNSLISKILCALETVVKATEEAQAQAIQAS